jgi:hypothetical protein
MLFDRSQKVAGTVESESSLARGGNGRGPGEGPGPMKHASLLTLLVVPLWALKLEVVEMDCRTFYCRSRGSSTYGEKGKKERIKQDAVNMTMPFSLLQPGGPEDAVVALSMLASKKKFFVRENVKQKKSWQYFFEEILL